MTMNILPFKRKSDHIIRPLVKYSFHSLKYLIIRINYQLWQYQQRQIPLTYSSIRPAILITITGWMSTIMWFSKIQWGRAVFPITNDDSARIFHISCFTICVKFMTVVSCILEFLWIIFIRKLLKYESGLNDFLIYYSSHHKNIEMEITSQNRKYLFRLITIADYLSIESAIIFGLAITYWMLRIIYELFILFNNDQISTVVLLFSIQMTIIEYIHCLFLISLILMPFKALIIVVELIIVQIKQFFLAIRSLFDLRLSNTMKMQIVWHSFQKKYNRIFNHIAKLNADLKVKELPKLYMVRYSSVCLISIFCLATGVYARLSIFPSFNQQCCERLLAWNVRISQLYSRINDNTNNRRINKHQHIQFNKLIPPKNCNRKSLFLFYDPATNQNKSVYTNNGKKSFWFQLWPDIFYQQIQIC
ncbi:hypothetical protein DERF_013048 [Dermatophagoides farinae]|uniref:Uncharacterized protein n=1 Tax=Dermatophagoides farinae TaxID=6954 RepID=A0A922HNQ6_DERFA|nr:hypothetical protein DERF_013048 [Dermatophagoides farinae]